MASSLEPAIKMLKAKGNAPYAQQWYGSYELAINSVITNVAYQTHRLQNTVGKLPPPTKQAKGSLSDIGKWKITPTKASVKMLMSRGGSIVKGDISITIEKTTIMQAGILESLKPEISTAVATYLKSNPSASVHILGIIKNAVNSELINQCQSKGLSQESLQECQNFASTVTVPGIVKNLQSLMQKPISVLARSLGSSGSLDPAKNLYSIIGKTIRGASVYRVKEVESSYPISCSSNKKITEKVTFEGITATGGTIDPTSGTMNTGHTCRRTHHQDASTPVAIGQNSIMGASGMGGGADSSSGANQQPSTGVQTGSSGSPPAGGMPAFRYWINTWFESALYNSGCPGSQTNSLADKSLNTQQKYAKQYGLCTHINEKCLKLVSYKDGNFTPAPDCSKMHPPVTLFGNNK